MTQHPMTQPPALEQATRDEFGRLIAGCWRSGPEVDASHAHPGWLVAIDGSACAERAAATAIALVQGTDHALLDLVFVHPWLVSEAAEFELPRQGWAMSAATRERLDRAGIAWRMHLRMGEAAPEIVSLAASLGSLGIVIGSHGLTAVQSLVLGSVTYKVVHLSKVPVLIVR